MMYHAFKAPWALLFLKPSCCYCYNDSSCNLFQNLFFTQQLRGGQFSTTSTGNHSVFIVEAVRGAFA